VTAKWNILAPIDLSRGTEGDVRYALQVASALGADLHLLYVAEEGSPEAATRNWPTHELDGLHMEVGVSFAVLDGRVATNIAQYADSVDANLVLMSSRRYGRWSRLWRPSVTEEVMRLTRRPVFVSSPNDIDGRFHIGHRRILCLVGLDSRETALIEHAQELADRTASELVLLHVVPEASEALLYHAVEGGARPLSRERAIGELAALMKKLRVGATTSVMIGDPGKCARLAAREHSVDIVLASRARSGLQAAYGNYLSGILSKLDCPLVTIPVDFRTTRSRTTTRRTSKSRRRLQPVVSAVVSSFKHGLGGVRRVPAPSSNRMETMILDPARHSGD
jgi:nucleotide-binding universal stress UspA family protein